MFGVISQEFKIELTDAFFFGQTLNAVVNPGKDNNGIETELQNMVDEFNNISAQQGKNYTLNIPEIGYEPLNKILTSFPTFSHPIPLINKSIRTKQLPY